uniref:Uncharacterized protein n=1 Tax=Meloidogyne enterolobii TaxID=390850 RepID=A0A6V7WN37_MELEN|nr:unnamed protein product [Meloidogyne enterolobii]
MRICHELKRSKMVFLHRSVHFRTRFLMHIFAYFGTFVHICISVHILANFAYFGLYFGIFQ